MSSESFGAGVAARNKSKSVGEALPGRLVWSVRAGMGEDIDFKWRNGGGDFSGPATFGGEF